MSTQISYLRVNNKLTYAYKNILSLFTFITKKARLGKIFIQNNFSRDQLLIFKILIVNGMAFLVNPEKSLGPVLPWTSTKRLACCVRVG